MVSWLPVCLSSNTIAAEYLISPTTHKFLITALLLSSIVTTTAERKLLSVGKTPGLYEVKSAQPTYKFIVPLNEEDVFQVFQAVAGENVVLPVIESLITIAISANQTVVWYDEWEDGYDEEFLQPSTRIWGDANATNGCPPNRPGCSDEEDILYQGDVLYLEHDIPVPRDNSTFFFDSGDFIFADYPLTISRWVQADIPNTTQALSGAVEVVDDGEMFWGKGFVAPVGPEVVTATNSFGLVKMMIMSGEDENEVVLPTGETVYLQEGESIMIDAHVGDAVKTSKKSLASCITADPTSTYEMRILSLLPDNMWSNEYIAPVGDETGKTNILLYNPGTDTITVDFTTIGPDGEPVIQPIPVDPKSTAISPCVGACCAAPCPGAGEPRSGARLKSTNSRDKFAAFSVTNVKAGTPPTLTNLTLTDEESGQAFDWGFPLMPKSKLTHQAQVSLGVPCRKNDCQNEPPSSTLWITPDSAADLYVDRRHIGGNYDMVELDELESAAIDGMNLSGAIVFATKKGSGIMGKPVNFAGAWGRNAAIASRSSANGGSSLKIGMSLLPYNIFGKSAKKGPGTIKVGETIKYEIVIENLGHVEYGPGEFLIHDELPEGLTYVEGSLEYSSTAGSSWVTLANDADGTIYQLDEAGLPAPDRLLAHGGVHMIKYSTTVDDPLAVVEYNNEVDVSFPNHEDPLELDAKTKVRFQRNIKLTVGFYLGNESENRCSEAISSLMVLPNSNVTYCVEVKNTGKQPLVDVNVTIPALGINLGETVIPFLGEQEKREFTYEAFVPEKALIDAKTISEGNPIFHDGRDIWTLKNVKKSGSAKAEAYNPSIRVVNLVSTTGKCKDAKPEVAEYDGKDVLLCFTVTNTGNSDLSDISVTGEGVDFFDEVTLLEPGKSTVLQMPWTVTRDLVANITVIGQPSDGGSAIAMTQETDTSVSYVSRLTHAPSSSPSGVPSQPPTISVQPSATPTSTPTAKPSMTPTSNPTAKPSSAPSANPTVSFKPTGKPSSEPSGTPTSIPSAKPSLTPTSNPTAKPSSKPSATPTSVPSAKPSVTPSSHPTAKLSSAPSATPTSTPTSSPSNSPSAHPTGKPSAAPSTSPTRSPSEPFAQGDTRSGTGINRGGGGGDPHFKTWSGHKFDYHGECDLVLAHVPSLNLRVHIRTTRRRFFSYIERVAVQLGNDVIEFANRNDVLVNGKKWQKGPLTVAGYPVNTFPHALSIRLNDKAKARIDFINRKSGTPYVVLDGGSTEVFADSRGLLGDWSTGAMIGRNGTVVADPDTYAEDWQVRDTEPLLFQTPRAPQYPARCIPPERVMGSRLGDSIMRQSAEKQCKAWNEDQEECIFDVMAMRDIRAAEDPAAVRG